MLLVSWSTTFKRSYKRIARQGKKLSKLNQVITKLANSEILESKYRDHKLIGDYVGLRECHIEPNWLLIYEITEHELRLHDTGTHSDLFG